MINLHADKKKSGFRLSSEAIREVGYLTEHGKI
jgi:hypothetical protein